MRPDRRSRASPQRSGRHSVRPSRPPRTDDDHRAALAGRDHVWDRRLAGEEGAGEVDVKDLVPVTFRQVLDRVHARADCRRWPPRCPAAESADGLVEHRRRVPSGRGRRPDERRSDDRAPRPRPPSARVCGVASSYVGVDRVLAQMSTAMMSAPSSARRTAWLRPPAGRSRDERNLARDPAHIASSAPLLHPRLAGADAMPRSNDAHFGFTRERSGAARTHGVVVTPGKGLPMTDNPETDSNLDLARRAFEPERRLRNDHRAVRPGHGLAHRGTLGSVW